MLLEDNNKVNRTRQIAIGGLMSALAVVCMALTGILPTIKLTMLVLASVAVGIVVVECGIKYSLLVYGVVSVLSFFIVPYKSMSVLFVMFFGIYPVMKFLFEAKSNKAFAYILKFVWLNSFAAVLFVLVKNFFMVIAEEIYVMFENVVKLINTYIGIDNAVVIVTAAVLLNVVFFVYDFVFSNVMFYYEDNIKKKIKF